MEGGDSNDDYHHVACRRCGRRYHRQLHLRQVYQISSRSSLLGAPDNRFRQPIRQNEDPVQFVTLHGVFLRL